jgi:hypothetical protein
MLKIWVISLFSSNFQHFNTFCPLFQKLLVKFELQTCSACQDLPTRQAEHVCSSNLTNSFWNKGQKVLKCWKFDEKREITPKWVTGFTSNLHGRQIFLFQKLLEINVKFKLQTCSACQDLPTMQFWSKSHNPFWSYFPFFIKFSTF